MTKRAVIITASILLGLIATLTILFGMVFRVKNIDFVYGDNFYYKQQISDILKSSKLNKNDSIFSVKHNKIINNIELEYPYARVEGVNIKSFTNITIKLSNRIPLYYFVENEQCFILDEDCKVLEKISVQNFNINNFCIFTFSFNRCFNMIKYLLREINLLCIVRWIHKNNIRFNS